MTNDPRTDESKPDEFGVSSELLSQVTAALKDEDKKQVRKLIKPLHAADVAEIIHITNKDQRAQLIDITKRSFDADVLPELEEDIKEEVFDQLGSKKVAKALSELEIDEAIDVIEDVEAEDQQEILEAIADDKQREELEQALSYAEDTAGRLMNPLFVAIPQNWNVGKVIDYMRKQDPLPDDFYSIYVVDKHGTPQGWALVSRVIRSKRDVPIAEIMESDVKTVTADTDQEDVAILFRKYGLTSLPVLGEQNEVIGVITIDDIVDVMDEEAEEDILKLAGIESSDIYASAWDTAKQRFPWLFVNLLTAIAASIVIAFYDDTIEKLVALAVLMPIVASMAGNAGTQTLTVAVRGLATRELSSANAKRVVKKELMVSILNGLLFAAVVGSVSFFVYYDVRLSAVFAAATIGALVMAALSGALVPLSLEKMGVDTAIASSVFVTTVTDISGFFFFLGLASWWLF